MSYAKKLERALRDRLGDKVVFLDGWSEVKRKPWPRTGVPVALMAHHTAGAATDSTNPRHPGNQKGANMGVVRFVHNAAGIPKSNFTLDRDGTVYVHNAWPVHHAGLGSFKGVKQFAGLMIPDDMGNDYMLGCEFVSKGLKRDFTKAQKDSWGLLANACRDASGWRGFYMRLPNHKTWAPSRKIDTRYTLLALRRWALKYL